MSYLEWGSSENPPMILLHDVKGPALSMEWAGVAFSREFHVLAPDQICRGHSDWADLQWGDFDSEDIEGRLGHAVATIGSLIQKCDAGPAVLIGGSTGGTAAALYGAHHPKSTAAMVVDDGAILRMDLSPDPSVLKSMGPIVDGENWFESADEALASAGAGTCTANDPRSLDAEWLERRIEELLYQEGDRWRTRPARTESALYAEIKPSGMRCANAAEIQSISRPTLVFHNATRSHWNESTVEEIRELNPEWVRVVSVPTSPEGPGPLVFTAAPKVWLMCVQQFLATLP